MDRMAKHSAVIFFTKDEKDFIEKMYSFFNELEDLSTEFDDVRIEEEDNEDTTETLSLIHEYLANFLSRVEGN